MRIKQKVRICVDFAMILLMPCLMAYSLISGKMHEWLGMAMFLLFFAHQLLNLVSLCMPVQYLVVGVGTGIGVGVNSVLSKKLGEKDGSGVNKTAGNGFVLLWIVMILFAVLGLTAIEPFYIS